MIWSKIPVFPYVWSFLLTEFQITNGACHAKHIVVFAQLYVDGKNEGIHGVLVNCRDKNLKPMPGVTIEDMGHKVRNKCLLFMIVLNH